MSESDDLTPWQEHERKRELERMIEEEGAKISPADWAAYDQAKARERDAGIRTYYIMPDGSLIEAVEDCDGPRGAVDATLLHKGTAEAMTRKGWRVRL